MFVSQHCPTLAKKDEAPDPVVKMGVIDKKKDSQRAGSSELAAVLPADARPWYLTPHLIRLNLLLLVPLLSSATVGYDGANLFVLFLEVR